VYFACSIFLSNLNNIQQQHFILWKDVPIYLVAMRRPHANLFFSLVHFQFHFFQSCLALRYEALVMREFKSASCQWLQVSPVEWLRFVEDAVRNGFHTVAEKVRVHIFVIREMMLSQSLYTTLML